MPNIRRAVASAEKAPGVSSAFVKKLIAPFRKKGPDGKLIYSKADRKRVYQLLLVTLIPPARASSMRPELQTLAGELAVAASAQRAATPKAAMDALLLHFKKNPPNPQLLADINAAIASVVKEIEAGARRAQVAPPAQPADIAPPPRVKAGRVVGSNAAFDKILAIRKPS